jgi:uroporphyrinogen III methyltransferase/synthase
MTNAIEKVYLVGAGPGDPDLITLRAKHCLARADVVLYDYLANPEILEHLSSAAEQVCLGRHGHGRLMSQDEIIEQMVAFALEGKTVVRLKGGDPAVFARSAEETDALDAAGVPYEIVPGVTAALAVGSYAGISLTHRDSASAVALVTGQETDGKQTPAINYQALADFPGTLVIYMGVTTAKTWTAELIAGGKSVDTPAAIVQRCSWPNQRTICCTLETIVEKLTSQQIRPPAIIVVGEVAREVSESSWFTNRPLFGHRILITRPESQVAAMRRRLAELGADVLVQPAIEIGEPDDMKAVDAIIQRLEEFDWLVFSSSNGVRSFVERMIIQRGDVRPLAAVKLAAIGSRTADALAQYHLQADLVPDQYQAEVLAEALVADGQAAGKRFLLLRASRGREVLAETLREAKAEVEQVVVYKSTDVEQMNEDVVAALNSGSLDWITVTSSAIARSLDALLGDQLHDCRLASISPITSATLRELGHEPAAEAKIFTMDGLVDAILAAEQGGNS